jgi:nucleoside 2-deoxyribosyltransferase
VSSFYFAARFTRRFELQGYRADLSRIGHAVTSRWIDDADGADEKDNAAVCALRDVQDLELSDGIISFLEAPRTPTRGGRHVEFGMAAAEGKRLIAIGAERENVFYHLPEVELFRDWQQALAALAPRERISLRDVWAP